MTDTPDIGALVAEARLTHLDMKTVSKEHVNPLAAKLADALEAQQAVVEAARGCADKEHPENQKARRHAYSGHPVISATIPAPLWNKVLDTLAALDAKPEGEG